jgi:hypothetical protein
MKCFECDNTEDCTQVVEIINCPCCNETIECSINMCVNCGLLWKSINDEVTENSIFRLPDNLLSDSGLIKSCMMDLGILPEGYELDEQGAPTKINRNMSDFIHKCIKCNGICYEERENVYKCLDCGFELEVVDG